MTRDGMSSLVDQAVPYDLAESTVPPLRTGELLTPEVVERLRALPLGYGGSVGSPRVREQVAALHRAGGSPVGPDDVLLTSGAAAALSVAALACVEPGRRVVLATPCFPPSRAVPTRLRAEVVAVPLDFAAGYRLDLDALRAALTPDTRLVSLASPQNPSGIRFTEDELRELVAELPARAPEAVLLLDETYLWSTFVPTHPRSAAGLSPRVLTCSSLSKSHGAPGLRLGWLTATDPELRERLRSVKFSALICSATPDEVLAEEVLRRGEEILAERRRGLTAALATLGRWADEHADLVEFLAPDGGALCTLRLRAGPFDPDDPAAPERLHAALRARDARIAPGSWFGESDRVLRLGFGHLPASLFGPALDRLGEALREVAAGRRAPVPTA